MAFPDEYMILPASLSNSTSDGFSAQMAENVANISTEKKW